MLIVAGYIELDPDHVDRVLEVAAPAIAASRDEAGCQEYVFSLAPNEPGRVRIFEIWDDDAALRAHFETPHMTEFMAAQADLGITEAEVIRYEVSGSRPLM